MTEQSIAQRRTCYLCRTQTGDWDRPDEVDFITAQAALELGRIGE